MKIIRESKKQITFIYCLETLFVDQDFFKVFFLLFYSVIKFEHNYILQASY